MKMRKIKDIKKKAGQRLIRVQIIAMKKLLIFSHKIMNTQKARILTLINKIKAVEVSHPASHFIIQSVLKQMKVPHITQKSLHLKMITILIQMEIVNLTMKLKVNLTKTLRDIQILIQLYMTNLSHIMLSVQYRVMAQVVNSSTQNLNLSKLNSEYINCF